MKLLIIASAIGALLMGAQLQAAPTDAASKPSLTDAERQQGWKLLFDGVSPKGWRGLGTDAFPSEIWRIEDGCLHCIGGAKADDLVTEGKFENFDLRFEWRVPKLNGNSGVKYRVQEKKGQTFAFGPEYQCMYDPETTDKHASGSLYDVLAPEGKKLEPIDQFNTSRILVQGSHVEHWLNGVKVVDFDFDSERVKAAVGQSKFKNTDWAKNPLGHIILQDHHDEVWFRNIRIRELPASSAAK